MTTLTTLRRSLLALTLSSVLFSSGAYAASDKPECIAPAKPGGGFDITCRLVVNGLEKEKLLDRPMMVSYMPGGIGAVAYNHINGVRSDSPNLIVAVSRGSALNLALGKFGKQYDGSEVRWVGGIGVDYGSIVVSADAPWKNLDELMKDIKSNPGKIALGAGGTVGSQDWMKAALVGRSAGVDPRSLRYVSFEGGGEAMAALLGGHIQVFTGDLSELKAQLDSGKIRVLAVLSEKRMSAPYENIPTAKEQGYDVEWPIWRGFYMGPKVSDEDYQKWVDRLRKLDGTETFAKLRESAGLFPMSKFGNDFDSYVKEQITEFKDLSKELGLTQ